jgi:hypothetical protein
MKVGNFEISQDILPEGWRAKKSDPWTMVLKHETKSDIEIFYRGPDKVLGDERGNYSVSISGGDEYKTYDRTPELKEVLQLTKD